MSLKTGIGVGVALLSAMVVVAFGLLAYGGFVRQQDASMRQLLAAWARQQPCACGYSSKRPDK